MTAPFTLRTLPTQYRHPHLAIGAHTLQEIIATSARVRDQACQISIPIEDNSIRPWAAAAVDFLRGQDRKLIVRPADREGEALVVVVPAFISDRQTLTIGTR